MTTWRSPQETKGQGRNTVRVTKPSLEKANGYVYVFLKHKPTEKSSQRHPAYTCGQRTQVQKKQRVKSSTREKKDRRKCTGNIEGAAGSRLKNSVFRRKGRKKDTYRSIHWGRRVRPGSSLNWRTRPPPWASATSGSSAPPSGARWGSAPWRRWPPRAQTQTQTAPARRTSGCHLEAPQWQKNSLQLCVCLS